MKATLPLRPTTRVTAGALLLAKARPADARVLNLLSVLLTLLCTALLGWLVSPLAIIAVRGIAGLLSAVTLIAASLWLLQHMKHHNGAPVLYSGVGMGIFCRRNVSRWARPWRSPASKYGCCAQ